MLVGCNNDELALAQYDFTQAVVQVAFDLVFPLDVTVVRIQPVSGITDTP